MNERKTTYVGNEEQRVFALWRNEGLSDMEKKRLRRALKHHIGKDSGENVFLVTFQTITSLCVSRRLPVFLLVLLMVFVSSGIGIARASLGSLPGEALYSLKTDIVEPVRGILSFTEASRVAWERSRIEERIREADTLLTQGRLGEQEYQKIDMLIEKHGATLTRYQDDQVSDGQEAFSAYSDRFEVEVEAVNGERHYRLRERSNRGERRNEREKTYHNEVRGKEDFGQKSDDDFSEYPEIESRAESDDERMLKETEKKKEKEEERQQKSKEKQRFNQKSSVKDNEDQSNDDEDRSGSSGSGSGDDGEEDEDEDEDDEDDESP